MGSNYKEAEEPQDGDCMVEKRITQSVREEYRMQ